MKDRIVSVLFGILLFFLIITFSIGLPIYFRPFYYLQVEPLDIPRITGKTAEEIIDAYDEVLDYLTLPGQEFGVGVFEYSEDGKSHFEDCKVLFDLNGIVLLLSAAGVCLIYLLSRLGKVKIASPLGFTPGFFSGAVALFLFLSIGALAAMDFNTAFTVFHKLLFPGKENWIFNPYTDPIILAMPIEFFVGCAVLIASSIISISLFLVIRGAVLKKRKNSTL